MSDRSITDFPDAPDIESSTWDYANRFSRQVGNWLLERQRQATEAAIAKAVAALGNNRSPLSVLDVGGGHGQNIELVNRLGHQLTIFSSSAASSEVIDDAISQDIAQLRQGELLHLPFDDNSFDLVICYRILSHMSSWSALINELTRVSRHMVLVDYPSKVSVNVVSDLLFWLKKRIEKNTRRFRLFKDRQIDTVFQQSGYTNNFRVRQFFLPMALYRAIGNMAICSFLFRLFRFLRLTDLFGSPVIAGYIKSDKIKIPDFDPG